MSVAVFKENLNKIMAERQITQRKLSMLTGISTAGINKIVAYDNSNSVNAETLEKLSMALGVSMDELYKTSYDREKANDINSEELKQRLDDYFMNPEEMPQLTVGIVKGMINDCKAKGEK